MLAPLAAIGTQPASGAPLKDSRSSDERIIFFPSAGWKTGDRNTWNLPVRGWIFEPETDSVIRNQLIKTLENYFDESELNERTRQNFRDRIRYFLFDNESGKELTIQIAGQRIQLPESDGDGQFRKVIRLSADEVMQYADHATLPFKLLTDPDSGRPPARGVIHLFPPEGQTVISDIDDTIKISHATDRKALLRHTFLEPFQAVPGMSKVYRCWRELKDATFVYLSNTPRQFYEPLASFAAQHDYPAGVFDLLDVRFDDHRLFRLFADSEDKKAGRLERYLRRYPQRKFILVGDAGQADAEVYGRLARHRPDQVQKIYIRELSGGSERKSEIQKAFKDVPTSKWTLFHDPETLTGADCNPEPK